MDVSGNNRERTETLSTLPSAELVNILVKGKRVLFFSILVSTFIGVLVALTTTREYTSWTTMVPQVSNPAKGLSGISSLAAMAGFNLDMAADDNLPAAVYPQIVGSVLFQLELMEKPFFIEGLEKPVDLYTYYYEYARLGLCERIGDWLKNFPAKIFSSKKISLVAPGTPSGGPVMLTREQEKIRKKIEKQVVLNVDVKNAYLTLYARFPDAGLSAQVAEQARELLQKYVTEFKIKKAAGQLTFIEERHNEKKAEFLKAQQNLALFRDKNRNIASAIAATEEERLKGEYTIALTVYNELTKQLEQAKIKVKEDTPVFAVIQPTRVPLEKSKPRKALILTVWFFIGAVAGIAILIGKSYLALYRQAETKSQEG